MSRNSAAMPPYFRPLDRGAHFYSAFPMNGLFSTSAIAAAQGHASGRLARWAAPAWAAALTLAAAVLLCVGVEPAFARTVGDVKDVGVPVALVRDEGGRSGLDVIPVPLQQIEMQVLAIARQHTQRSAALDDGEGLVQSVGEPVTQRIERVEVALGAADPRLKLAPCDKVNAYVPEGSRLWGRSRVGLRCEQGAVRWNIFVPVVVKVWGRGVIPVVALPPGAHLEAADLQVAEVDLAAENSLPLLDPDEAIGRVLIRGVQAGQSLRQSHLKPRRYFAAGDPVQLVVKGSGFAVSGAGFALNPGDENQGRCVRVRTENGRVVCGRPVAEGQVELVL